MKIFTNTIMAKIENEVQYNWAVNRVESLLPLVNDATPLTDPNSVELAILSNLVADYSEEHFSLEPPSLADVLKLRMYELELNQKSLSKLAGVSPSRMSEYLSGKSEPTLEVARSISRRLNINASVVLGV
jgi:HTH-type transcriptional regulator/antitoxin HigA